MIAIDYQSYIKEELLALIPVLYFVGSLLKKSNFPDKHIPASLGVIAVLLAAFWVIATNNIKSIREVASAIFTSATQGILIAGASVYVNQLNKQFNKES